MVEATLLGSDRVAVQNRTPELDLELAEAAAAVLGYDKLKEKLTRKKDVNDLSQVLQELDIQPLCRDHVERYKAEQDRATAELADVPEFLKRHRKLVRVLTALIPLWVVLLAIGTAAGWLVSWMLSVASLVSVIVIFKKGCELEEKVAELFPTWERVALAEYGEEVPLYVLRKAVEIKKRLSDAEFYIEQHAKDPFLIVRCGGEEHYVEVWQEPRFEAPLMDS